MFKHVKENGDEEKKHLENEITKMKETIQATNDSSETNSKLIEKLKNENELLRGDSKIKDTKIESQAKELNNLLLKLENGEKNLHDKTNEVNILQRDKESMNDILKNKESIIHKNNETIKTIELNLKYKENYIKEKLKKNDALVNKDALNEVKNDELKSKIKNFEEMLTDPKVKVNIQDNVVEIANESDVNKLNIPFDKCIEMFKTKDLLKRHKTNFHDSTKSENKEFKCDHCNYMTYKKFHLHIHMKNKHGTKPRLV